MLIKDYYGVLETEPSADLEEIKKAYRRLAHLYHPDKNASDPYAAAKFSEIKEAYEVLTNPLKKEVYLQQRWYNQSIGFKKTQHIITPVSVLKQTLELEKYVSTLDIHRIDRQGLSEYLQAIVDDEVTEKLRLFNEPAINDQIVALLISAAKLLTANQFLELKPKLIKVSGSQASISLAEKTEKQLKRNEWISRYQPLILFLLVIIICIFIYFISR